MSQFSTPMMQQYMRIKDEYADCLLFFRLGDFYELFLEDAKIGSKIMGISLTSRSRGKDGRIPMAGVPYHAVGSYLAKVVKAGYKVAICEQVSEPTSGALVERKVVRVITPGTVLDDTSLEKKENNYIVSFSLEGSLLGMALADISTGVFYAGQFMYEELPQIVSDEFVKFSPSECILSPLLYETPGILKVLKRHPNLNIYPFAEWDFFTENASRFLKEHFGLKSLAKFGLDKSPRAFEASAVLLGYLKYTQKNDVEHIKSIKPFLRTDFVSLDGATILNLELFSTIHERSKKGSLMHFMDKTTTSMGARLLKRWLLQPLLDAKEITSRHDLVDVFVHSPNLREKICSLLQNIADIERLLSRISVGISTPRDLIALKTSLQEILRIKDELKLVKTSLGRKLFQNIPENLAELIDILDVSLVVDPPLDPKKGGLIQPAINTTLDELRTTVATSKSWVAAFEEQLRKKTGISSLKVKYNQVFGYYIEVTKANLHLVPATFVRKQTLVNAERFITPALKEHEDLILVAEEKINALEYSIFLDLVGTILSKVSEIQQAAESVAILDCIISFAILAQSHSYARPSITSSGVINIREGRHPVVESLLDDTPFVPNDVLLDPETQQLLLITGPNMSGKSVFMRQVAIIVLMAQVGSFVPALNAEISLVDKIFVRSGAADVISLGLSTFMLEMVEAAHILNNATSNSLVVLDEIGRGTSTYDGISIAWAVAEYLTTSKAATPKTLFATHYHELQTLEDKHLPKIKNYQVLAKEIDGHPVFLHEVVPGGADHSYGIAVARLAGLPEQVIARASTILENLELRSSDTCFAVASPKKTRCYEYGPLKGAIKKIKEMNLDATSPLEALHTLMVLQKELALDESLYTGVE